MPNIARLDSCTPGTRVRLTGTETVASVCYVVPEIRVRVRRNSEPVWVTIGTRSFLARRAKEEDWAPSTEVEVVS